MVKVRQATLDDGSEGIRLSRLMHDESPRFRSHTMDIAKIGHLIIYLINSGGAFVAEEDGQLVGMLAGIVSEDFFGPDKVATDLIVYMIPEKRASGAGLHMIKMFERWAISQGATEICLGVSTGINTERTVQVYERFGYQQIASTTVKRV